MYVILSEYIVYYRGVPVFLIHPDSMIGCPNIHCLVGSAIVFQLYLVGLLNIKRLQYFQDPP